MPYYRKKPILVEGRQYTGDIFEETYEEIDKHHDSFIVRPTLAEDLRPGDLFRNDSQSFQIKEVERTGNVIEITYSFEGERLVNSFYIAPNDTLDKVVESPDSGERANILKDGADPFQDQ